MTESATTTAVVERIHANSKRGVFAVTGGGSALLAKLLTTAGASATVLEAHVPYAEQALRDYLGSTPAQACSAETARALAMRSFIRSREIGGDFGFGIAAALATTRKRRGEDRAHIAFQDATHTRSWTLPLAKQESRRQQEAQVTNAGLAALAFALGVGDEPQLATESATAGAFKGLLTDERSHVATKRFKAILPGAFNPLHRGHRAMREDATRRLATDVGFELCMMNVDKPPLDYIELSERLAQFAEDEVVVTNTPTFIAKAHALGGATFVLGVDTLVRIADARYYGGRDERTQALAEMRALGCRFLVYGRCHQGGFKTSADVVLPADLAAMCITVPEAEFRIDISSTDVRRGPAECVG